MKTLLAIIVLAGAMNAQSQSRTNSQSLYWTRYQNQLFFSEKLYWNNEFDNRRFFHPDVQNQFIIHSRLHFRNNGWDFGGGFSLSWIYSQIPQEGFDRSVAEVRGVAEAAHQVRIGKITFQNRIRLDNRFFQSDVNKSVFNQSSYVLRFRYRAQVTIPLKSDANDEALVVLRLADEIMFNHTSNAFDQNRIYVTCDFRVTKNLTAEAGYIYIYQQRFGTETFFERHVIRATLLHKIWVN